MAEKDERNTQGKLFKEQDDLVVSKEKKPVTPESLLSIRRSELTSMAPDDINWNKIFVGKNGGIESIKSGTDLPKKKGF